MKNRTGGNGNQGLQADRRGLLKATGGILGGAILAGCGSGGTGGTGGTGISAAATQSSNAALGGLILSAGSLSPAFAAATTTYALSVGYDVSSTTVTATAAESAQTIRINGTQVGSGAASAAITLSVGSSTITVLVTAQDGSTTRSYTITVTRAAAGSNANLNGLAISNGSLTPSFAAATTSYTVSVANDIASITVTPTLSDSAATVRVNGTQVASGSVSAAISLAVGSNTITILVAAQDGSTKTYTFVATRAAAVVAGSCNLTPQETEGPYPLLAILSNSIIARADITEGKAGVPLTLNLVLTNTNKSCAPLTNVLVYIWHCDKDGVYSGYTNQTGGVSTVGQTFLRGVLATDSTGVVTFKTIYPGWYAGRITHIHFQVYVSSLGGTVTATSQLAFPPAITTAVYNSSQYSARGQNTSVTSFAADGVFSDGTTYQLATVTGDVTSGYVATLNVGVAA